MSYKFCIYKRTSEVHILGNNGKSLCGMEIYPFECEDLGIYTYELLIDENELEEIKPFENLSECEAIAVAHALQVLQGVNICANFVRKLYKNE